MRLAFHTHRAGARVYICGYFLCLCPCVIGTKEDSTRNVIPLIVSAHDEILNMPSEQVMCRLVVPLLVVPINFRSRGPITVQSGTHLGVDSTQTRIHDYVLAHKLQGFTRASLAKDFLYSNSRVAQLIVG